MSLTTTTHLNFRGDARAALDFYHSVFGGDVVAVTQEDTGNVQNPDDAELVMWGQVLADNGFHVMAYDAPSRTPWNPGENAVFVSVRGDSTDEITSFWEKLAVGSTIVHPLEPAQWAPIYGMLKDRFGVVWVLDVAAPYNG